MKYKNIIWDWNGTLFDDVDACIKTMNELLISNDLKCIKNREQYRKIFCFPVKGYYQALGFDFDKTPFEDLANTYIRIHVKNQNEAKLFNNAIEVLNKLQEKGCIQYIVSATEQKNLLSQIKPFEIESYFSDICGIENHFAKSKIEVAKKLIESVPLEKENTLFIGDSIHDWEVAENIGCQCILIANGHQSIEKLKTTGAYIISDIENILQLIYWANEEGKNE